MAKKRKPDRLLKGDAVMDQVLAELTTAAVNDVPGWAAMGRKINHAAGTRANCEATPWDAEELYRLVRLAHAAHGIITGRLLGRNV